MGNEPTVIQTRRTSEREDGLEHPSEEEGTTGGDSPDNSFERDVTREETEEIGDDNRGEEAADQAEPLSRGNEPTTSAHHRRYPNKKRKTPAYFSDYANWVDIPEEATK